MFCFHEVFLSRCGISGSPSILTTSLCSQVMWISSCALETSSVILVSTGACGLVAEVVGGGVRDEGPEPGVSQGFPSAQWPSRSFYGMGESQVAGEEALRVEPMHSDSVPFKCVFTFPSSCTGTPVPREVSAQASRASARGRSNALPVQVPMTLLRGSLECMFPPLFIPS